MRQGLRLPGKMRLRPSKCCARHAKAGAACEHVGLILRGRSSTWSTSVSFCAAGAALGAPKFHFAWQAQHWKHLSCVLRLRGNTINTTPSTQHHQHNIICTTPSTQHHQDNTIDTTPSIQHQLHNIIHTTPSALHHHILAGAGLGALPFYPFCLIPADTPLVILRCGLFFVLFRWPLPHLDVRRHC